MPQFLHSQSSEQNKTVSLLLQSVFKAMSEKV